MMLSTANSSGRLAIVDYDKCKPDKCNTVCIKNCPPNQTGKLCITIGDIEDISSKLSTQKTLSLRSNNTASNKPGNNANGSGTVNQVKTSKKAVIANNHCIGCGICVNVCPFGAISIINLPKELTLDKQLITYGDNSFRVYMCPHIKKGQCLGIIGSNGLGKTTIIKILSGDTKIDCGAKKKLLGGSETYSYLTRLQSNKLRVSYKQQDIGVYAIKSKDRVMADNAATISQQGFEKVSTLLEKIPQNIQIQMDLTKLSDRTVNQLSGGETQRLLVSLACAKEADAYLFDEPSAFLDIKQRIIAGNLIQEKVDGSYVVLIEHDLCIFDYISDYVVALYGEKGAYGVVSSLSNTFNGINNYLEGYLPTENIKFRDKPIRFRSIILEDTVTDRIDYKYGGCRFSYQRTSDQRSVQQSDETKNTFTLEIESGTFSTSEITLLVGENGTGKSTMIKMLAGIIKADEFERPEMSVSIKEQEVYIDSDLTVSEYIYKRIGNTLYNSDFKINILNPLGVDKLFDLDVNHLSGGQMQRVAITICLGTPANIYLLDEPSAYIDVEDRIVMAKMLRSFAGTSKASIFLVEHDIIMATSTCDKVIVFTGEPGVNCIASTPVDIKTGINSFLKILNVTMRRDKYSGTGRPRINKRNSLRDNEQKKSGQYFIMD